MAQIERALSSMFEVATGIVPRPQGNVQGVAWDKKNWRALSILNEYSTENVRSLIKHLTTAAQVWSALVEMYEVRNASNKHTVQQKFFEYTYNESQPARENVSRLNSLVADCRSVGIDINRESVVTKLIHALPVGYDPLIYAFRCRPDAEKTLEILTGMLVDKDALDESRKLRSNKEERSAPSTDRSDAQPQS